MGHLVYIYIEEQKQRSLFLYILIGVLLMGHLVYIYIEEQKKKSLSIYISYLHLLHRIHKGMSNLYYNRSFLLLLLITTGIDFTLSSCLQDTVGTCGCCTILPQNVLLYHRI
jgi:recombinational DNA repair protein (RecF pathway)